MDIAPETAPDFLILTAAEAASLAGPTADGAELAPLALADGETFVLPLATLTDPAHAAWHAALAALPVAAVARELFPAVPLPAA